jgi:hypothetical protein
VNIAAFLADMAELVVRDGLIEGLKWHFARRKTKAFNPRRKRLLAKRRLEKRNRRARR